MGGCVGPRAGLDSVEKLESLAPTDNVQNLGQRVLCPQVYWLGYPGPLLMTIIMIMDNEKLRNWYSPTYYCSVIIARKLA
jgi:hypothetical protein